MAKKEAKKKSNLLVWLGLGAAAIVGFMVVSKASKTPQQRFLEDAKNPSTEWGAEVQRYLSTSNPSGLSYNDAGVIEVVNWHIANNTAQYQKYL